MSATKIIMGAIIILAVTVIILSMRTCRTQGEIDAGVTGDALMSYVKGIEGNSPAGRRQYITDKLKEFGVPYTVIPFDTIVTRRNGRDDTLHGENIIAHIGMGTDKIIIGAHSDAVPGSPGANDNGGGVAVLLELIRSLKALTFRHTIDFCFFDLEEAGLIGSAVYVRLRDPSLKHVAMINLDVEGTGEEIYVGPVGGGDDDLIMKYIHEARDKTKYMYQESEHYPGSDHESFGGAKLENISMSVVPKGDAEKLARWAKSGHQRFEKPEDMPEALKVMHTPHDSSTYMSADALNMSYVFTKTTLLLLDEGEE